MSEHGLFQFADVDRVAAGLDDILHAADQPDEAEAVARGKVAGAQPSVGSKQALAVGLVVPVVGSEATTVNLALAGCAGGHAPSVLIDHADAKRRHGQAEVDENG